MSIAYRDAPASDIASTLGTVAVFVRPDGLTEGAQAADEASGGAVSRVLNADGYDAKAGEIATIPAPAGMQAAKLLLVGLGKEEEGARERRVLGGKLGGALGKLAEAGASIFAHGLDDAEVAAIAGGIGLRRYAFDGYKSEAKSKDSLGPGKVSIVLADTAGAKDAGGDGEALAAGVALARDLVNEPANVLYPASYAERLKALESEGLEVEVLGEDELERLGMNALLAVGRGSRKESQVVVMKWWGADDAAARPFALVGKGVTFDTGGISIKPAAGMEEMTMDMGGSAAVAGTMLTLAKRKAKANVVGVVGLVENMPDGDATRPGDIVAAMSGTTVEIINTDAEGRLVLADVLHHVQREFEPTGVVNLATLTGAIIIALGHEHAGLFSNDDALANDLLAAAEAEGEGLWRMPLGEAYDKQIKSRLADIKNTGGRPAGSITAAQFLQRFIKDGMPWAHIDIAGVALGKEAKPLHPKGATGWGVATLDRLIRDRCEG